MYVNFLSPEGINKANAWPRVLLLEFVQPLLLGCRPCFSRWATVKNYSFFLNFKENIYSCQLVIFTSITQMHPF